MIFNRASLLLEPTTGIKINKWNIQEVRVAFDDSVVKVNCFFSKLIFPFPLFSS